MVDITRGSLEEQIIKLLQKNYPITTFELALKLHISQKNLEIILKKFQIKGIVKLDILPDKVYVRLLRSNFKTIGTKLQRKPIKKKSFKPIKEDNIDPDSIMYS